MQQAAQLRLLSDLRAIKLEVRDVYDWELVEICRLECFAEGC
jgi:hypothetical protein